MMDKLDDEWRPDLSGVVVEFEGQDIPLHYEIRTGIKFLIVGPKRSILRSGVAEVLGGFVEAGVPTFLSIPGPEGHFPAKTFLNDAIHQAVSDRNLARVQSILIDALEVLIRHEFVPVVLQNGPR